MKHAIAQIVVIHGRTRDIFVTVVQGMPSIPSTPGASVMGGNSQTEVESFEAVGTYKMAACEAVHCKMPAPLKRYPDSIRGDVKIVSFRFFLLDACLTGWKSSSALLEQRLLGAWYLTAGAISIRSKEGKWISSASVQT